MLKALVRHMTVPHTVTLLQTLAHVVLKCSIHHRLLFKMIILLCMMIVLNKKNKLYMETSKVKKNTKS